MLNLRAADERRRAVRFLLVGIGNTAFGYAIFAVLVTAGLDSAVALLAATITGVLFNFFTTGRLVFSSRDNGLLPRFVAAYGVSYCFNLLLLKTLEANGVGTLLAQVISLPPTVVLSFVMLSRFVFSRKTTS